MAKIIIPSPLRKFTDNNSTFETNGSETVQDAIVALTKSFPQLEKHLLDDDKNIRSFIRIYVGEEDINLLEKQNTRISQGDIVSIIPAIAGGSY